TGTLRSRGIFRAGRSQRAVLGSLVRVEGPRGPTPQQRHHGEEGTKETMMPFEVTVKQAPPQHVAEVRRRTTVDAIGSVFCEAVRTLMNSMGRAHERPVGPPFVVYDRMDLPERRAEIEVCVLVGYRFIGDDDVEVNEIPGGAVASTIHHGPCDALGSAYEAVDGWIRDNSLVVDGPPRQIYLTDPQETPDRRIC